MRRFARCASSLALAVSIGLFSARAPAEEAALRSYPLTQDTALQVYVPKAWKEQQRRVNASMPPTIVYQAASGAPFVVLVTPVAPAKPGEYKYLAQGLLGVGTELVSFTILTNDGQEAVVDAALELLRSARLVARKPGAKPAAAGGGATK